MHSNSFCNAASLDSPILIKLRKQAPMAHRPRGTANAASTHRPLAVGMHTRPVTTTHHMASCPDVYFRWPTQSSWRLDRQRAGLAWSRAQLCAPRGHYCRLVISQGEKLSGGLEGAAVHAYKLWCAAM
ncbi:hypothetical protein DENSPDRAFT_344283 [Dentipellis sp. KUC8613]|nr:hypothetical protein DENSPDRAFT_344283 [Dentipellis sp. KUC8613]